MGHERRQQHIESLGEIRAEMMAQLEAIEAGQFIVQERDDGTDWKTTTFNHEEWLLKSVTWIDGQITHHEAKI